MVCSGVWPRPLAAVLAPGVLSSMEVFSAWATSLSPGHTLTRGRTIVSRDGLGLVTGFGGGLMFWVIYFAETCLTACTGH